MRYVLLIYGDESRLTERPGSEREAETGRWYEYTRELREAGVVEGGEALEPTATATCVRTPDGEPLLTDGPFAETKEQLGGFYVLDVPDLDAAIHWANKCPAAKYGTIELRPIMELPEA